MYPTARFLNADEIQMSSAGFAHPLAAGRELLIRLAEAEQGRHSFALETTLSSVMYVKRIELPSADYAVARTKVEILLEAARRATWDATKGPRHLRSGRFRPLETPDAPSVKENDAAQPEDVQRGRRLRAGT